MKGRNVLYVLFGVQGLEMGSQWMALGVHLGDGGPCGCWSCGDGRWVLFRGAGKDAAVPGCCWGCRGGRWGSLGVQGWVVPMLPLHSVYPLFPQGQQGPGGVRPDAPIGGVSWGADPPPDDGGGLVAAGGAARGGPRCPRPPCTHALAAPHPQPLHLDGGTLLRSVPALGEVGWVLNPSNGVLTDPPSPQASGTLPCTRTCPLPSPPPCPAPCSPCSPSPRTPLPSSSSSPRSPPPMAPPTRWVSLRHPACAGDGGPGGWGG